MAGLQRRARALKADPNPPPDMSEVLPAASTIVGHLDSWPNALFEAGFIDVRSETGVWRA